MQHRDMLPFLITSVIENEGNGKSHFSVSVSKNATEGIFRGSNKPIKQATCYSQMTEMAETAYAAKAEALMTKCAAILTI